MGVVGAPRCTPGPMQDASPAFATRSAPILKPAFAVGVRDALGTGIACKPGVAFCNAGRADGSTRSASCPAREAEELPGQNPQVLVPMARSRGGIARSHPIRRGTFGAP